LYEQAVYTFKVQNSDFPVLEFTYNHPRVQSKYLLFMYELQFFSYL